MELSVTNLIGLPEMLLAVQVDATYVIKLFARVLHILSAIILVGGLFYIRSVLSPSGVEACYADRRAVWAKWVGMATGFLLISGLYNLMMIIGQAKADGIKLPPAYHMLFGIKFLLALLVMFIAAILAGKTDMAEKFRGNMRKWLNIAWLASMAIIVIAAILRTMH